MSKFVPKVPFELEFEDDKITMMLQPLKRADMAKLAPHLNTDEDGVIGTVDSIHMMDVAAALLPRYVSDFNGLTDLNGEVIPFESVVEEAYFINLLSEIMVKIFEISRLSEDDSKNSGAAFAQSPLVSSTVEND